MNEINTAKELLKWFSKKTTASAELSKNDINDFFSATFKVKANGLIYDANHDNYLAFLNQFRASIKSINYQCHYFIHENESVVISLTSEITRLTNTTDIFEAILILKFNDAGKVTVWDEVYVKIN